MVETAAAIVPIQSPVAVESTQHPKSATNTPLPPSPTLTSFPSLPTTSDPDRQISRHQRRPSRAERYEGLVEGARKMLKGVENSREEAAPEESAGEVDKAMDEGEWILCVKNLLQVVDGMSRQLATHDELSAQLKIAQSNLTLAESHSEFLEESLRRKDLAIAKSNGRNSGPTHAGNADGQNDDRNGRPGSGTLYGLGFGADESTTEPSESVGSIASGFFSRRSATRKKGMSLGAISNPRSSPNSVSTEWIDPVVDSNKSVMELSTEVGSLRALVNQLRSSSEAAETTKDTLSLRCDALEKTKNDLMEELENLSVELFQEANLMVSSERKARAKAEEELEKFKAELRSTESGISIDSGDEGLRRAEMQLEEALGLLGGEVPMRGFDKEANLERSGKSIGFPRSNLPSALVPIAIMEEEDKSTSSRKWWDLSRVTGKKATLEVETAPTLLSSSNSIDFVTSPTTTHIIIPPASSLAPQHQISASRPLSHHSIASSMTTDSHLSSSLSSPYSPASSSAPFLEDRDYLEEATPSDFELPRPSYRFGRRDSEATTIGGDVEAHSVRSTMHSSTTLASPPDTPLPHAHLAKIIPPSNVPLASHSPSPSSSSSDWPILNTDFPPEAAYAPSEIYLVTPASLYPLPPSPSPSLLDDDGEESSSSNIPRSPAYYSQPFHITPPMGSTSTFDTLTPPSRKIDGSQEIDLENELTPRSKPSSKRGPPPVLEPRSLERSRGKTTSSMALRSLAEGSISPSSPNMARWREKSGGLVSPAGLGAKVGPSTGALGSGRIRTVSEDGEVGKAYELKSKKEVDGGSDWDVPPPNLPGRSGSLGSIALASAQGGSWIPVINTETKEALSGTKTPPYLPPQSRSFGDLRREIATQPNSLSNTAAAQMAATKSLHRSTSKSNWAFPLPPGTTFSSYSGISPSGSLTDSDMSTSKSFSSTHSSGFTKGVSSGMVTKSSSDLDDLMKNIALFGDEVGEGVE